MCVRVLHRDAPSLHRTWANFDGFILQGRRLFGRNWLTECLSHYYELDTSIWRVFLWGRCWWRRWGCDEIVLSWLIGEPTVAIWTFTFHKKSGFVRVILKANLNLTHRPKSITFLGWKFRSIKLIFLLFFAEFVKSTAFYTLLLLHIPKSWHEKNEYNRSKFPVQKIDGFGL